MVIEEFDLLLLGEVAGVYPHSALMQAAKRGEPDPVLSDRLVFVGLAA